MGYFSYCFCITLLHSLWQSALLMGIYFILDKSIPRNHPIVKRNIIYLLLTGQLLAGVVTFLFIYNDTVAFDLILPDAVLSAENKDWLLYASPWFIAGYFAIVLAKATRLSVNWYRFRTVYKASLSKPSIDLRMFTALKAMEFGIKRKVSIWFSEAVNSPVTFSFFKPVILLPVALINNLSVEETEALIIHELTHIRNNDYLLNWLLVITETIFFFNPFILAMGRHIRMEREKQCDVNVLQFRYPPITYAESLLKAAYLKNGNNRLYLTAASSKNELLQRIEFFTRENNLRFYKRNYSIIALAPLLLLFTFNIFVLSINQKEKKIAPIVINKKSISEVSLANTLLTGIESINLPVVVAKAASISEKTAAIIETTASELALQQARLEEKEAEFRKLQSEYEADVQAYMNTAMPASIAVPATLTTTTPENSRQVTVTEEDSETGTTVVKVYRMVLVNGEWKSTLLWSFLQKTQPIDSTLILKDSTGNYNLVQ